MTTPTDKILDRIRKLLAMSKDTSSPNEAAIAARRARALIDEHQVSELDLTSIDPTSDLLGVHSHSTGQKTKTMPMEIMAVAVATLNDCIVQVSRTTHITYQFKGLLADAATASLMLSYLTEEAYSQAKRNAEGRSDRTAYRLGFASGVAHQVRGILEERSTLKTSTGQSLVVCKGQLVAKRFGAARYVHKSTRFGGSLGSFHQGKEAGKKASLNRQVSNHNHNLIGRN